MKIPIHPQSSTFKMSQSQVPGYDVFDQFKYWYFDEFVNDPLYRGMDITVEKNSPWHIEASVGIHTNMVVTEYLVRAGRIQNWNTDISLVEGAFAAAFHDVGKKSCLVEKHSEARGDYVSFPGHEIRSARLWEDWAIRNLRVLENRFGLTVTSIHRISWMIEHHLPWGVKKADKLNIMMSTVRHHKMLFAFLNVLLADTYGRISTDAVEKRAKVNAWIKDFTEIEAKQPSVNDSAPVLVVPIGASGSGKTTVWNKVIPNLFGDIEFKAFSMDQQRHDWYDADDYTNAYTLACADKQFKSKSNAAFMDMIRNKTNIYCDNTNLSRKSRAFYVTTARQHGYRVVAIPLLIGLDELMIRQEGRKDKVVPADAVKRHYLNVQQPQYGEFDEIYVHDGNLPKLD